MHGVCLRQRDNFESLERCFVAVDGICCHEMLIGGTAEVQVRDPCTLTREQVERIYSESTDMRIKISRYERSQCTRLTRSLAFVVWIFINVP